MSAKRAWNLARGCHLAAIVALLARVWLIESSVLGTVCFALFFVLLAAGFVITYQYHRCAKCNRVMPMRFRQAGECQYCKEENRNAPGERYPPQG